MLHLGKARKMNLLWPVIGPKNGANNMQARYCLCASAFNSLMQPQSNSSAAKMSEWAGIADGKVPCPGDAPPAFPTTGRPSEAEEFGIMFGY